MAEDYPFGILKIPLAGFHARPWDQRSACIAVADAQGDSQSTANRLGEFGAPTALVCDAKGFDWWKFTPTGAVSPRRVKSTELEGFFREHKADLSPQIIYSAKMRRPLPSSRQLWFLDVGLLPIVERRAGEGLRQLVEGTITNLEDELGDRIKRSHFSDLYKTVFWLLAAKLLKEKEVEKFRRLDLKDVRVVFERVGKHYAAVDKLPPGGKAWFPAIERAAGRIAAWPHLGNTSPEALAYLYEKSLIDREPVGKRRIYPSSLPSIRKRLGIHSTPQVLIDHMLAQMWPLIEDIPPMDRYVLEPACGHAGFLVAAMRWLRAGATRAAAENPHAYLRERLQGIEIDPFACELARLSLTLADVPHGNHWRIVPRDIFVPSVLVDAASKTRILLANPPYEAFGSSQKRSYERQGEAVAALTPPVELLNRTLPHLPVGGVFGVVVPQGFLNDRESEPVRKLLLKSYELDEISIFSDNLFEEADHETAVLIGRRIAHVSAARSLSYRRVREHDMKAFRDCRTFSSDRTVPQSRFAENQSANLLLPDLEDVWDYLRTHRRLGAIASIHQGFKLVNSLERRGKEIDSARPRKGWVKAYLRASGGYRLWELPEARYLNPDRRNFSSLGAAISSGLPQVLLNYARVARAPWRLKAALDLEGGWASSRFLSIRATTGAIDLRFLWAVLNSPIANAYSYCHSAKRETLVKEWTDFPCEFPSKEIHDQIVAAAERYLLAARRLDQEVFGADHGEVLRQALLEVDAAVLRFYDLPPRLERQLLDLFEGFERKGVGFDFLGYYPRGFESYVPLHELISEEYNRSLLRNLRAGYRPVTDPVILSALREACETFSEE